MSKKVHDGNKARTVSLVVLLVSVFLLSALAGVPFVGQVSAAGYTEYTGTLGDAHFVVCFPDTWNGMLVVFCRGYSAGRVLDPRTSLPYNDSAEVLLNQGFAVAASGYGTGGMCLWQGVNDTYSLTNYLIDTYHITGKVFLFGGSMGGTTVLLLGEKYPNVYSGVFDMFGPTDYKSQYETWARWANLSDADLTAELAALNVSMPMFMFSTLSSLRSFCKIVAADTVKEMGGTPDNASQAYEDRSPVYHAAISIPVITLHGANDGLVPLSQSFMYRDAVANAGRSSLYRLYAVAGGQHGDPVVNAEIPARFAELVAWSNALTGIDWPMFRHDVQHTGYSESPAPSTNQTLWNYTTGGVVYSSPSIADGRVYVGSFDNNVYCLDAATGTKIWNYTTGGDVLPCPAVADGKVYAGSTDKNVYCLNAATGALIWSYATGGNVYSHLAVANGIAYVGSLDMKVHALNATNGASIWNYTTGGQIWSHSPAVADGKVYIGSHDDKVYCLDAATGALVWNYTTGDNIKDTAAVANGRVYIGSKDNNVYCLDAATGAKIWNYTTGFEANQVAIADGMVYVGSGDYNLYCLDAATGAKTWNYTTGNQVISSPAVADGKVYVGSLDNKVYCLNAAGGALIWSYTTGGQVYSSPAVANGVVYVGSLDGKVYAFSSSPPISASGWSKTYGGTGNDYGRGDVLQTSDGGYVVSGYTGSFGAGGYDVWMLKTDAVGNMEWNKTYGGNLDDTCNDMCPTDDGGYALLGSTTSFGSGGYDFWLVRTDASGNMQWNKSYGGPNSDYGISVVQTGDGGYAVSGYTDSFGGGDNDAWVVKTDANGSVQWNKTYGGTGGDYGKNMIQAVDGGYAVGGYTNSSGAGGDDVWLVKTDASGVMLWNKTYGGTKNDRGDGIVQAIDGGYIITGYTDSFSAGMSDIYLVKTDGSGIMQWNKTYGGTGNEQGIHTILTADGGYAIIGFTSSFAAAGIMPDFWLVKIDSSGNVQWNKTYGGANLDVSTSVFQTIDGGYALAGWTDSFGAGNYDFWLVKTDASGVIPESLTLMVIMLLSSVAAIVGTTYFRKPARIKH